MTRATRDVGNVHERLVHVQEALKRVRAEQRVLNEQVTYLRDVEDDARTRKLVAQTPLADRDWREAKTDLDRHGMLLDEAGEQVEALVIERDWLLDRLLELEAT